MRSRSSQAGEPQPKLAMVTRSIFVWLVTLGLTLGGIHSIQAQTAIPGLASARTATECSYDTCALRIEEGSILQGVEGRRITDPGRFGWSSDSAMVNAQRYQTNRTVAVAARVVAFSGTVASLGLILKASLDAVGDAEDSRDGTFDQDAAMAKYERQQKIAVGISLGSSAVGLIGRVFDSRARKQLSRAVWWHNRAFARP